MPFRSFHEQFGYLDAVDVNFITGYSKEYSEAIDGENQERNRRIDEFENKDLDNPSQVAALIQKLPLCIQSFT